MRLISLGLLFIAVGFAQPKPSSEAYIQRGKMDLGFSGNLTIPHGDSGSVNGNLLVDAGYYVSSSSLLGGEVGASGSSGGQSYALRAHYRYLFPTNNPRLFPFVGGSPGLAIVHTSAGPIVSLAPSSTNTNFTLRGEAGVRYFVAPNVSVEGAYNLSYIRQANVSFLDSSISRLVLGLAFTF